MISLQLFKSAVALSFSRLRVSRFGLEILNLQRKINHGETYTPNINTH